MASIEIIEIGDTYINAKLTGLSTEYQGTARTAYWTLSSDGGKTFKTYATSDLEAQDLSGQVIRLEEVDTYIEGLKPNTEYVFTVVVYNRDTNTSSSGKPLSIIEYKNSKGENLIRTKSATSSEDDENEGGGTVDDAIEYEVGADYIKFRFIDIDEKYTKIHVRCIIESEKDGVNFPASANVSEDGCSDWIKSKGSLSPDTRYIIVVKYGVIYESGLESEYKEEYEWTFTTLEDPRPDKFVWETSNLTTEETICVTASDWNTLMDNINAVREYCGASRINFVSVVPGVTKISADIYNEAVNAIKGIGGKGVDEVVANDYLNYKVKASHFTALSDAINSIEK